MKSSIIVVICALLHKQVLGFKSTRNICNDIRRFEGLQLNMAAPTLLKKGKMKEVHDLLDDIHSSSDGQHIVKKFIETGELAPFVQKLPSFYNSTRTLTKTLSCIPEYNKKSTTGFIMGLPPPEIMGLVLRESGARGVFVSIDKRSAGTTSEDFHKFAVDQTRSKKLTPGPLPLVWNDFIVDNIQITRAAAYGASGIVLSPDFADNLENQIAHANSLGVESVVMIRSLEEAETAIAAGARCLCMHTLDEAQIIAVRKQISNIPDLIIGARLRPEMDFSSYAEIDTAWLMRDSGFNFVWPSPEAVYATGMGDIYATVNAMRAKASRLFLSPRQFVMDRKKEGSREYLGDILY